MPIAFRDPTPQWINDPSVTDSTLTKVLRALAKTIGADDPASQVMGIATTGVPTKGIKAYHGSPHDFDKFSMEHVGAGEGNQAFGKGLYFAEDPIVAKTYAGKVSAMKGKGATINGRPIDWNNPEETAAFELWRHNGNREKAARFYESTFQGSEVPKLLRGQENLPTIDPPGKTYEVNIKADPNEFLDWDKPYAEQHEVVRQRMEPLREQYRRTEGTEGPYISDGMTGHEIYRDMHATAIRSGKAKPAKIKEQEVVDAFRKAGIPGIKYLDQGSRTAGEGTRNYVVFDAALIEIKRKFAHLLPLMGAASFEKWARARAVEDTQRRRP